MSIVFTVPDLACSACVGTVTQAIQAIDTTAQIKADPTTKQVEVTTDASEFVIKQAIVDAGYTVA
ncbi:heavy-metal-associated domain-containing protein [Leptolyngbya sp. CCNP1308]|uniref:heavy-metal-associated domain-containing protein n=1 Tax=Leptolyngbya sp. CCNP1308 TaxID=3110255 RepID=UPI002B1FE0BB|nr:heavy-metal-associated domain-containing protein [Leptolyngbya sp. CCNP1308]MEA5449249.1 heavy-metal-associated domain-containing protein [Leptolyngbya sp. CCNP1308]